MTTHKYLEYIYNTGGGATVEIFKEDWEPVGGLIWSQLVKESLVETDAKGKIFLSDKGTEILTGGL